MQLVLDPDTEQDESQWRSDQTDSDGWKSHLWFPQASISFGEEVCNHVAQVPSSKDSDE